MQCEVLVIGAGPAGSACARRLAQSGVDVLLVDQQVFPREKVCGDGLIPDAHRAFERLGVLAAVQARAQAADRVVGVGPAGSRVEVRARLAVLPRRELDEILRQAALEAGARWLAPARFETPLSRDGRVVGARLRGDHGAAIEVRARWTVLATGAGAAPLEAAGVGLRRAPSGIALRGYIHSPALAGRFAALEVVWHRSMRGGYGWIFPGPQGVFNIGVGIFQRWPGRGRERVDGAEGAEGARRETNLRAMLEQFANAHEPARELLRAGNALGPMKGAPLRCSLEGARWSRPGMLVAGDAAGSTFLFTGEGIGKAMETGIAAAEAIIEGGTGVAADETIRTRHESSLAALRPLFRAYERANRINAQPWIADLLIRRAARDAGLRRRLSGVLEETEDPGALVSTGSLMRMLLPFG